MIARAWRAPVAVHAAALMLVLVVVMLVVGTHASFSSDEGAAIVQARQLADGTGWITPNPFPTIDPTGEQSFTALSEHGDKGTAPFAKHFSYPVILALADRVGGVTAMVGLSVLGCVAAAVVGGRLARRLDPSYERPTLWALGVGSPLIFDSQLVIAHTIGAAAAGGVVLALVRARERWSALLVVVALVLLYLTALQRNEAILLGGVLALVLTYDAYRQRSLRWFAVAVAAVGVAGLAALTDRYALGRIIGAGTSVVVPVKANADFLRARVSGISSLTILTGDSWPTVAMIGLLLMVIGVVAAGLITRSRSYRSDLLRASCAVAVVGLVLTIAGGRPDTIPGLLVACPVVLAGLVVLRLAPLQVEPARFYAIVSAIFVVAVAALQYNEAGAAEWGARFLALILPVLVPLAVAALAAAGARIPAADARIALASLVVISVGTAGLAAWSLRYYHGTNARYVEVVAEAATDWVPTQGRDHPVVVTTWAGLGRLWWPQDLDVDGLTVASEDVPAVLQKLRDEGVDRLTFVSNDPSELEHLGGFEVVDSFPRDGTPDGPAYRLEAAR